MTGFFERRADKSRWIRLKAKDGRVLAAAGMYEDPNRHTEQPTFTFATTVPNDLVAGLHDRMPVFLEAADVPDWLDCSNPIEDLKALLIPCSSDWFDLEDAGPTTKSKAE